MYKISVWANSRIVNGYKGQCSPMRDILINELRVTSYELLFAYELEVTICCASYELHNYELHKYDKADKYDKAVYDNRFIIKN